MECDLSLWCSSTTLFSPFECIPETLMMYETKVVEHKNFRAAEMLVIGNLTVSFGDAWDHRFSGCTIIS